MTATDALTADLKGQVKLLADDLRTRIDENPARLADWDRIHREAVTKDRTAMTWVDWREDRIDQAAVAWVLATVFIRFCEDNSLVRPVWIGGPPDRRQEALDAYNAYFRANPEHSDREWLESAIAYLRNLRPTKLLVDAHSALEYVSPSGNGVAKLREFWLRRGDDGALIHDLHDESLSTRFLGDLYQDLSDYAKEKYALLQTPVFVEEFILDRTLEPALAERQLEGFRMIDPTCGSGHFLLGAFARLLDRWHKHAPAMEVQARVQTALDAIHGVDLNPFAVAIARFRLTVAALSACELRSLEDAPAFKFHLAVGDSLIHGPDRNVIPGLEARSAFMPFHYTTEDAQLLLEILEEGRYDTVVGNPPYITAKDKALNRMYRAKFGKLCKGTYALTVPFTVQFFALARRGEQAGWVGMIASNSFMKREFGEPLIEKFLPQIDLRFVIDSEGAWIPGHNSDGTPTVIIVGKKQLPTGRGVRCVLSKGKRETRIHGNNGEGPYWSALTAHLDDSSWDDDWITISDLDRNLLAKHPWSLIGGGGFELLQAIESGGTLNLSSRISRPIGRSIRAGSNDAFVRPYDWKMRNHEIGGRLRPLLAGDDVRNWSSYPQEEIIYPYSYGTNTRVDDGISSELWPYRSFLAARGTFSGDMSDAGRAWWEYMQHTASAYATPLSIAYAEVASHNHFSLDRGGRVFKQTAPIIKLPGSSAEEDYCRLLAVLNSSVACFWIRQNAQPKGGAAGVSWLRTYQVSGTTLQDFVLPTSIPASKAKALDALARELAKFEPTTICSNGVPSADTFSAGRVASDELMRKMVALQEELDWEIYRLYGLIDSDLTYRGDDLPGFALGERAFEIALARSGERLWFERHESRPITEIPPHWPTAYQDLVQRRLTLIIDHPYIKLLEKPEYKRRWELEPWEKRREQSLRNWLLDRFEDHLFWFDRQGRPWPRSVAQLSDEVARDADLTSVLALWEGRPDVPVTDSLRRLLAEEAVPFHAGYRYKDAGLRKREAWEETWALQRREDAGEQVDIQKPPPYASADFQEDFYARLRGELDVPKERFILYPGAARDGDGTQLLGWAGWDHAEQALALATIINDREDEGWLDERLVPLIAGLAELQPWVDQWHRDVNPDYGVSLAAFCAEELATRAAQVSMTEDQLRRWGPEKKTRKGRAMQ